MKSCATYITDYAANLAKEVADTTFLDVEFGVTVRGAPVTSNGVCRSWKELSIELGIINAYESD